MPYLLKENNAHSTINQVGGLTLVDTELIVSDASSFPATGDFLITIWDSDTYPDPTDDSGREIIKVTGVAGNTFTIERGQEDTVASKHTNGTIVAMLITAGTFEEIEESITGSGHEQNTDTILLGGGEVLDQSQLTHDINAFFYACDTLDKVAQTFIPDNSGDLTKVIAKIWKNASATNPLIVEIRTTSAGKPTDTVLATETIQAVSFVGGEWEETTITFSSPFEVVAGTTYAVVIRTVDSNAYYIGNYRTTNPYADGSSHIQRLAEAWVTHATDDLYFQIYVTVDITELINNGVLKSNLTVDEGISVDGRDISDDGESLDSHIADTANPHSVTKAQVGLTDVPDLDTTDAVNHVSDTANPHTVEADQVATDDSGVSVQEALDALESGAGMVGSLFVQGYPGNDLMPVEDYFLQGGAFELDSNGDLIPTTTIETDLFFEYDINNDLIPKE